MYMCMHVHVESIIIAASCTATNLTITHTLYAFKYILSCMFILHFVMHMYITALFPCLG